MDSILDPEDATYPSDHLPFRPMPGCLIETLFLSESGVKQADGNYAVKKLWEMHMMGKKYVLFVPIAQVVACIV